MHKKHLKGLTVLLSPFSYTCFFKRVSFKGESGSEIPPKLFPTRTALGPEVIKITRSMFGQLRRRRRRRRRNYSYNSASMDASYKSIILYRDSGCLPLTKGASKPDESEGCSPVSGGRIIRLCSSSPGDDPPTPLRSSVDRARGA